MHAHPHRSGFSRAPDGHGKGRHQFSQLEVSNTIDHLSIDTILAAVKEIRSADRVYLLSRGLSQLVAKEFALKLQLIDYITKQMSEEEEKAERVRDVRDVEAFAARRVLHGLGAHDLALREIRQRIALVDGGVEVQYENQSVHSS